MLTGSLAPYYHTLAIRVVSHSQAVQYVPWQTLTGSLAPN